MTKEISVTGPNGTFTGKVVLDLITNKATALIGEDVVVESKETAWLKELTISMRTTAVEATLTTKLSEMAGNSASRIREEIEKLKKNGYR